MTRSSPPGTGETDHQGTPTFAEPACGTTFSPAAIPDLNPVGTQVQAPIPACHPTQRTLHVLFAPSATWWNPSDFAFDLSGRLPITEINNGRVLVTTGAAPTTLFSLTGARRLAVDALDRIVISTSNSTQLCLYQKNGTRTEP